jgi:hypothetical protein
MVSGGMIYISSFIEIGLGVEKLGILRQHEDLISLV